MHPKPRLLFLCQNLPYPPHGGQQIRSFHTLRLLAEEHEVVVLSFFRAAHHRTKDQLDASRHALEGFARVHLFEIPQEHSKIRLAADHLRSIVGGRAYVKWTYQSRSFRAQLDRVLTDFQPQIIHLDSLDLVTYLPLFESRPTVISHHNIESSLLERRARVVGGLKGRYMRHQAGLTRREESRWCSKVELNLVVSKEDGILLEEIAPRARWELFPNGVDTQSLQPSAQEPKEDIVFVGGHTWFPNSDGMEYYANEIVPILRESMPEVRTVWVGRAPQAIRERFGALGIEMTGYVDDIRDYVHPARCFVVPLRIGGGTRLKILDAWALGKAVVATSVGSEGLLKRDGSNILVGDSPRDFADAVLSVLRNPTIRETLESEGRKTAEEEYDWGVLAKSLLPLYRELLDHTGPEPGRSGGGAL